MISGICKKREDCRLCGSRRLERVLQLAPTPPANAFVPASRLKERQETYPLDVYFCQECAHVQLLDVVDPEVLFRDYVYVSGTSPVFVDHFRRYADALRRAEYFREGSRVVDIGSNDGTFLKFFRDQGAQVVGIDPAVEIARRATAEGIETLPELFSSSKTAAWRQKYGAADLIVANNVFAHIDDLADVVKGVREWLNPSGVFVFEVSYLADVVEKTLFDTIYHEHLSYHSVGPLIGFFERLGMQFFDAERIDTHGGSIRVHVGKQERPRPRSARLESLLETEKAAGLYESSTFQRFAAQIDGLKNELTALLSRLKSEGKKVAGFGAPAKATTLMHHFGLDRKAVEFIVDDSPLKQNLFSPGLHVPVLSSKAIEMEAPDYLLVLAWNFAVPIIQKNKNFQDRGGRFIVPVPRVEVIP